MRTLTAVLTDGREMQLAVTYDLPPADESDADHRRRSDVHRRREEGVIRDLDGTAAAHHRAKKAAERHDQREQQAQVQLILDQVIFTVEMKAKREQWRAKRQQKATGWTCPSGCTGQACARATFRLLCVPSAEEITTQLCRDWERQWEERHNVKQPGDFVGLSGYRFVRRDIQMGMFRQQEQELPERPVFQVTEAEVHDIQQAFLAGWDGRVAPAEWLKALVKGEGAAGCSEYLGKCVVDDYRFGPDRFGPDHLPVGRVACERRGCHGCCYCNGIESPPLHFPVRSIGVDSSHPETGYIHNSARWLTIEQIRAEMDSTIASIQARASETVPSYLLDRIFTHVQCGQVIILPLEVCEHVPSAEISFWDEQLKFGCRYLQFVRDHVEGFPDVEEMATVDHVLTPHQAAFIANRIANEEHRELQISKGQLDRQVLFDHRRGCGLRVDSSWDSSWPIARPRFHTGDLVYCPPPAGSSSPLVAVVMDVERSGGFGGNTGRLGFPTGEFRLLCWDLVALQFDDHTVLRTSREWELMPPCCGRGCNCPHLFSHFSEACASASDDHPPQWPNGDDLDPRALLPIPAALLNILRTQFAQHRKHQQTFESMFNKLTRNPFVSSMEMREPAVVNRLDLLDDVALDQEIKSMFAKKPNWTPSIAQSCKRQKLTEEVAPSKSRFKLGPWGLELQSDDGDDGSDDVLINSCESDVPSDDGSICSYDYDSDIDWDQVERDADAELDYYSDESDGPLAVGEDTDSR